jgi:hypothetical protein
LNDAFYGAVAASSHAGLTLAIVSGKRFLKIAEFSIRLPMIAQRRTAGSHRFLQHCFDGGGQNIQLNSFNLRGLPFR